MDLAPIEPWPGQHVACKDCLRGEPGLTASAILPSQMFQSSFGDHFGPEKRLCGSNNSGSPVASECITSINCLWHTMAYYGFVQKSSLLFLDEIVCVLFCPVLFPMPPSHPDIRKLIQIESLQLQWRSKTKGRLHHGIISLSLITWIFCENYIVHTAIQSFRIFQISLAWSTALVRWLSK